MRKSGILMPIASLPGKYGIGTFGTESYKFVDSLSRARQSYWQILPLGPTGYGDSPYQSFSTFAGNPYFIDLETLVAEGLLTDAECEECDFGSDDSHIDYEKISQSRFELLRKAYLRSGISSSDAFHAFCEKNKFWLDDYALYMAVKKSFGGISFIDWDEPIRLRQKAAVEEYTTKYAEEINFYKFLQYTFNKQWMALKKYANDKNVKIIGDIPIYVAFDSADTWANSQLFQFDSKGYPIAVAGCPPDGFSATGQLWGNPLYNWEYHKNTGYEWWLSRIAHCYELYDVLRVDHFRAFDEYYAIPYGDEDASGGKWEKGPGMTLFNAIRDRFGELDMIAEDLGFMTDTVNELVKNTGFPGMKIIQFAFDSREESDYMPHGYTQNSVVYTGTHDNNTLVGWYKTMFLQDRNMAHAYLNVKEFESDHDIAYAFIRLAMSSVSKLCVIPMQDYLALGEEARINTPSTLGGNWCWRMEKEAFSESIEQEIAELTNLFAR